MNGPFRILIVDDDEDVRETLGFLLGLQGYCTVTANDGLDALEKLRDGVRPDLILLDIMMPRLNGIGLAEAVHSIPVVRDITIVVLSGDSAADEVARSMGAAACLTKPVELDVLLSTVRRLLEEHANQLAPS